MKEMKGKVLGEEGGEKTSEGLKTTVKLFTPTTWQP